MYVSHYDRVSNLIVTFLAAKATFDLLLQHGADYKAVDNQGLTPLEFMTKVEGAYMFHS